MIPVIPLKFDFVNMKIAFIQKKWHQNPRSKLKILRQYRVIIESRDGCSVKLVNAEICRQFIRGNQLNCAKDHDFGMQRRTSALCYIVGQSVFGQSLSK